MSVLFLFERPGVSEEPPGVSISHPAAPGVSITVEFLDQLEELPGDLAVLPDVPVSKDNPQTPAKIELGKMLFFDPRLSGNRHWACSTCHNPSLAFGDGLPRALGFLEIEQGRHTLTLLNVAYHTSFLWDGRSMTLEDQAARPILNPAEMNMTAPRLNRVLNGMPEYRKRFQDVFGGPATLDRVAQAIAAFERTLVTRDSRFDQYLKGDKQALTLQEKRGLILFVSKAACSQCHNGPLLADGGFHNIGAKHVGPLKMDMGRMAVTRNTHDMHAFRTPTLRNIALTAPYMHDGILTTLEEVVDFYDKGGEAVPHKSPKIEPLQLTQREKADLVAFLHALTGRVPEIVMPQLPAEE